MRLDRNCPHCGKSFQTTPSQNQRYCSLRCSALCRTIPEKRRSFTKSCLECHIEFKTTPSVNKKFCSRKCCAIYYGRIKSQENALKGRTLKRPYQKGIKSIDGRRMLLSRFLMERKLGRRLLSTETVHHIDMDETNNPEDCSNYHLCKNHSAHMFVHSSLSRVVRELLDIGILRFQKEKYIIAQPYLPLAP